MSTPYKVQASSIEACNCHHGCNCQFEGFPNEGKCEMILGFQVKQGRMGDVALDGVRFAVAAKYPGAIHQGHGHVVLFIDEGASAQQADAVASILSGKMGGMPWEALAGTIERFEGPVRQPVHFSIAGTRSELRIGDVVALELAPLRNPVTGAESNVHIAYPEGGFFWNDASMATTAHMRVNYGDMQLEWPGRYAAAAEVSWTNQK